MSSQKLYVIILLCIVRAVHASDLGSDELTVEQNEGLLRMQQALSSGGVLFATFAPRADIEAIIARSQAREIPAREESVTPVVEYDVSDLGPVGRGLLESMSSGRNNFFHVSPAGKRFIATGKVDPVSSASDLGEVGQGLIESARCGQNNFVYVSPRGKLFLATGRTEFGEE